MKKTKIKNTIDTSRFVVASDLPYVNLESPQIKEQVEKLSKILKNLKQPLPVSN